MFRKLKRRLQLARNGLSPALTESHYTAKVGDRTFQRVHSSFNTKWLAQAGIDPKVIIDLGSFDGGDALRMANEFPSCKVISVEADPARFAATMEAVFGTGIVLENLAVCETDGPVPWFSATMDGSVHGQGSLYRHTDTYKAIFPQVTQNDAAEFVQGTRLDSLCMKHGVSQIDLLHMDIEGAELAALRSLGSLRPKVVFAEMCEDRFIGVGQVQDTHEYLIGIGYKLVADLGADRLYIHR